MVRTASWIGKVRVVFDCSPDLGEMSLNKQLMVGPDLINQLVGLLTRFKFRVEHTVYMADIETIISSTTISRRIKKFGSNWLEFFRRDTAMHK